MDRIIFVIFSLTLLSTKTFGSKSEEKCKEYLDIFKDKIQISPTDGWNDTALGKVPTEPGEFPHMAHLGFGPENDTAWLCGGILISDEFVLTTAYCTVDLNDKPVRVVRLGDYNITSTADDIDVQEFEVKEIIHHPKYKKPSSYNDIALLKLDGTVNFTKSVHPACLYSNASLSDDAEISATGWGNLEDEGSSSDVLMKVYLDLFKNEDCNTAYKDVSHELLPNGILEELMLCAGGRDRPKDTCQGDAGGPLQILNVSRNAYEIVGVTSFGVQCGVVEQPAVYTRVAAYLSWIESIVWI